MTNIFSPMRRVLSPRLFRPLPRETLGRHTHKPSSPTVSAGCSRIKSYALTGFQGSLGSSSLGPPVASREDIITVLIKGFYHRQKIKKARANRSKKPCVRRFSHPGSITKNADIGANFLGRPKKCRVFLRPASGSL